ncbi:MAG: hypothetical protein EA427_08800 [Spirochaetaceae bacterium]|nr:MAG: hypothetical protein EA427_08800 [Spirochaetaceae bacterium]
MRTEIDLAHGQEILFVGHPDHGGLISSVEVFARGSYSSVAAACRLCDPGDMIIHNHPGGDLRASDADVAVSARLAEAGIGSAIVDNEVTAIYVLVEPVRPPSVTPLDMEYLLGIISRGGAMERILPGFLERSSQIGMLRNVTEGFNSDQVVVAEAGTGVGKSFAYLLPAVLWAAQNGERVVIATATINLQQQLLDRDLEIVQKALGTSVGTALVKGRGNYLCLRRLVEQREETDLFSEDSELSALQEWAETSPTGSRSDLPFFLDDAKWGRVNSESDTCSASRCPDRDRCFILRARHRAAGAGILVANHHLLFSDLAIRNAGVGWDATAILPPFSRLVLDEAHNLERAATSFFSEQVSRTGMLRTLARLHRIRGPHRFGLLERLPPLGVEEGALDRAEKAIAELRSTLDRLNAELLLFLGDESSWRVTAEGVERLRAAVGPALFETNQAVLSLAEELARIIRSVEEEKREEPPMMETAAVIRRLEHNAAVYERFVSPEGEGDSVLWMDRKRESRPGASAQVALIITPLDIRDLMRDSLFGPHETVVLTSATLTVNGSFQFWGGRIGVPDPADGAIHGIHPSPFDYSRRVMLAVPADAPSPEHRDYERYLTMLIPRLVNAANGGALVLFTAFRRLEQVYEVVAPDLERRGFTCYRQGTEDRAKLLESFRADVASVLFATDSFWEGIDAPGETLRLVIVCRLPFRVPTDPVQLARAEAVVEAGGNAFADLSLPQAVMRLKQGFGRLMRRSSDYGVVVIADPRMVRKYYGRIFWESLPPARPLVASGEEIVEEVGSFLNGTFPEGE